ncbi:MAG: RrF2 family transcriptional regulator [Acidobacteriota bacterium]
MKITARVDYAILAVFELALHSREDRIQAREIAERQQIPVRFLEQILIQLKKEGLVKSIRGASGGYVLAKPANRINLKDIVEAMEGEITLVEPRLHPNSTVLRVLREIEDEFVEKLESITIQDLVHRKIQEEKVVVYHI